MSGFLARATLAGSMLGALLASLPLSSAVAGPDDREADYDIPAESLDGALTRFAEQSGAQIFYSPSLVGGKTAAPLKGRMSRSQALARLLRGTGLTAVSVNAGTYLLQAAPRSRKRAPPATASGRPAPAPARETPIDLHGVQVTGTRIPRVSLETATPVTLITREQIEASGFTTLFELLRHQPGMTGHHAVQASSEPLSEALTSLLSIAVAHSASLHGLGPRGTLYLVDGRRTANYALVSSDLGGLTDLGGIPLSMVERVEILRGGASAIYGADAVAGVVNIILKQHYRGGEVSVQAGISGRGDAGFRRLSASAGFAVGRSDLSVSVDAFSQTHLAGTSRDWHTQDRRADGLPDRTIPLGYFSYLSVPFDITPYPPCVAAGDETDPACRLDRESYRSLAPGADGRTLHAHWRFPVSGETEGYLDIRSADARMRLNTAPMTLAGPLVPPDDPNYDPFIGASHAFYDIGSISSRSRTTLFDGTLGFTTPLGGWSLDAYASHHSSRVTNTIHGVVNQSILAETFQHPPHYHVNGRPNDPALLHALSPSLRIAGKSTVNSVSIHVDGPVASRSSGDVRAAFGIEAQRDRLDYTPDPYFSDPSLPFPIAPIDPDGSSRRMAAYAEFAVPLPGRLTAEAAWRLDRASPYGSSTSPRLGLTWKPHDRLLIRGSIGNAFRAPSLYETEGAPANPHLGHPDPARVPNEPPFAPCRNPTGPICTLPVVSERNPDLKPERALARNLGLVWEPNDDFNIAVDYFNVVRRDEIAIADPVAHPGRFPETYVRDEDGLLSRARIVFSNLGRSDVRGLHFDANWRRHTRGYGTFDFRLSGHRVRQALVTSPDGETVDRAGHLSPASSAFASLEWSKGDWSTTASVRHFSGYRVHAAGRPCPDANADAGKCRNPSINVLALGTTYSGFDRWTVSGHVNNLADRQPANYELERAGYNASFDDPVGRYYLLKFAYRF
ncbi:TonB-dependent receptor domain-containing protein [Luteimonas salinilitoris]|uniref:TonB-dependent receptor n=1 Tax=Luteimonas salinilitoris TaxID=3237697 RepID=A0ABV4HU62_9GAMM